MDFLTQNTKSLLDSNHADRRYISAQARHVIVIGGGDTGTDCVATAQRHGCKSLVQLEILPEPPIDRAPDNPWPQWPKIFRVDYGQEEAAAIHGADPRRFGVLSKRFRSDGGGHVIALETADVLWSRDTRGRFSMEEIPGSKRTWHCDLVLLALGFLGPERSPMLEQLGVSLDARGSVATDEDKMTNVAGIFAAGDMRRGQSLVVWAIAEGRHAARCVDRHLMGETSLP
jgi:glutamate synthase (NADPH/NADH) small chain